MAKSLYDLHLAEESGQPITDPELIEVRRLLDELAEQIRPVHREFSARFEPGTTEGDIWIVFRRSSTRNQRDEAIKRLASGSFKMPVLGPRWTAIKPYWMKLTYEQREAEKVKALYRVIPLVRQDYLELRSKMERPASARQIISSVLSIPNELYRITRLRFEDEFCKSITGKSRSKGEAPISSLFAFREELAPLSGQVDPGDHIDFIRMEELVAATTQGKENVRRYLLAILESRMAGIALKKICIDDQLSYEAVKKFKGRYPDLIDAFFQRERTRLIKLLKKS